MKSDLTTVSVKSGNLSDRVATPTIQTDRPNQLWISDFTYVSTWQGSVCGLCHRRICLEWVFPFNHHQLHEPIGYIPSAEAEVNYYRQLAEKTTVDI
jgi:transposase InsO family protein